MNGDYALDTSVAIQFLNGKFEIGKAMPTKIAYHLPIAVTAEIFFGAGNSNQIEKNRKKCEVLVWLCMITPITLSTAECYSLLRIQLKQKGRPIPENDLWTAAQCGENHWTLLTGDKHFTEIADLSVTLV